MDPYEDAPFLGLPIRKRSSRAALVKEWFCRYYDAVGRIIIRLPVPAKLLLTRRYLSSALGCLFLVVILSLSSHRREIARLASLSSDERICHSVRPNSHKVKAPLDANIATITSFWPALKSALEAGGRDLPVLKRPPFQTEPPTEEQIRARTKLLTLEEATRVRDLHAAFIRNLPAYPRKTFQGRGIVMLAGGHYSEYGVTALGVLRESGSTLPVEVWRRDEREEKHAWCDEITHEGMACRRLSDYMDTDLLAIADGKEMKVFTMLFSSFEEVIFIDADNMALQPPELLFETEVYKSTGVLLWNDYWHYDSVDWLDYVVSISSNASQALWNQTTYESGQIVWNKRRNWDALLLATYYNYHGPDLYYTLLNFGYAGWGDKDTFPLALRALNKPFSTVQAQPRDIWVNGQVDGRRAGMLQMEPGSGDGQPTAFFLHVTTIKWSHRDFVCDGCLPIWHTESLGDAFSSRWEDAGAELHAQLRENVTTRRLLGHRSMPRLVFGAQWSTLLAALERGDTGVLAK
ncbi:hypothetical protein LTR91_008613 [Friedmanniomyces endolithicus]|uniref:Uncharacterized protein n=1 Tax=Friedmanniomyces endolithicus TaxID=329885 RepID=A0AAN6KMU1_9PEZI|nr:hypothetical protein LTR57_011860 [Friedmanniomyces endolithicus]KAK0966036.1 hypothetical protein LTS01_018011 [Friedmanniomyces endolithicus]KAK0991198.1 hypothetical protein LTR91_008613 [Friedmanniomyces endolithicus]KAK1038279.1 hypothetical protein LTS16_012106 [Friedmanniomyces endolithicus]